MTQKGIKRLFSVLRPRKTAPGAQMSTFDPSKPVLSCVVDQQPKFLMQSWVWLVSAKAVGAFEDCNVVLHHVGQPPDSLQKAAQYFGARLVEVESFGAGAARYCNKLQSHAPILATGAVGAILTDVDLFFLESPRACWSARTVKAKIVDHPNPPEQLLSKLAEKLDLFGLKYEAVPTFRSESRTHELNCNGGLYALPMKVLGELAAVWRDCASKCLSEKEILEHWLHHSDQIGFMMSMLKTNQSFEALDLKWNFPTHFKPEAYEPIDAGQLKILHYHDKLSPEGRLLRTGSERVDCHIERANTVLSQYEHLPEFKAIQSVYQASLSS